MLNAALSLIAYLGGSIAIFLHGGPGVENVAPSTGAARSEPSFPVYRAAGIGDVGGYIASFATDDNDDLTELTIAYPEGAIAPQLLVTSDGAFDSRSTAGLRDLREHLEFELRSSADPTRSTEPLAWGELELNVDGHSVSCESVSDGETLVAGCPLENGSVRLTVRGPVPDNLELESATSIAPYWQARSRHIEAVRSQRRSRLNAQTNVDGNPSAGWEAAP
jgi:hypothetical protein